MASNKTLVFTGIVLSAIGAIIAILMGIVQFTSLNPIAIAYGILYLALGLLALIFTIRLNKRYNLTYAILVFVFGIIILITGLGLNLITLSGILMILGVLLIFIAKA